MHQNVNIKNYMKLNMFLKRQSTGFISKKLKVLTSDKIEKFINKASDNKYLATKVKVKSKTKFIYLNLQNVSLL